jgi:hypothetical protein
VTGTNPLHQEIKSATSTSDDHCCKADVRFIPIRRFVNCKGSKYSRLEPSILFEIIYIYISIYSVEGIK